MASESLAENWFEKSGVDVRISPKKVKASCYKGERPSISFNPADPGSVQRAKNVARSHSITVKNRLCQNCSFPCELRLLDNDDDAKLLLMFGQGI